MMNEEVTLVFDIGGDHILEYRGPQPYCERCYEPITEYPFQLKREILPNMVATGRWFWLCNNHPGEEL